MDQCSGDNTCCSVFTFLCLHILVLVRMSSYVLVNRGACGSAGGACLWAQKIELWTIWRYLFDCRDDVYMLVVLSFFLAPALDPKILLISFSQKLLLHIWLCWSGPALLQAQVPRKQKSEPRNFRPPWLIYLFPSWTYRRYGVRVNLDVPSELLPFSTTGTPTGGSTIELIIPPLKCPLSTSQL